MFALFVAIFGLLIGSFLTVVVDRVPRGASIVAPGSACGACGRRLTPTDLVPVVSWLVLRGRCRSCDAKIGTEPLVVELLTAALFGAFAVRLGASWELPGYLVLGAALVALSDIDLKTQRLPREISYTAFVLGAPWLVVAALVDDTPRKILTAVVGAALALGFFVLVRVASRGGMGDGDVRLSPVLGFFLGWLALLQVFVGLFLGFLVGAVVGVFLLATQKAGRKHKVPFGPFLAIGTVLGVLFGEAIVNRWLSL
jgi:leader peptidase (prepilin peptidase)/N-methyltransferase